jgi:hypothetical protein
LLCVVLAGCSSSDETSLGGNDSAVAESSSGDTAVLSGDSNIPPNRRKPPVSRLGDGKSMNDAWAKSAKGAESQNDPSLDRPPSRVEFINPQRLKDAGLRTIASQHLLLVTDLPPSEAVDALPPAFDKAVPLWAEYFGVGDKTWSQWRMTGYLMQDPERFRSAALLPDELPGFKNGYTLGAEFWVYEQKSDYYRRHLLLHEGIHGFMFNMYGTCGPPWYMEGMAELLGTHKFEGDRLVLPYYPKNKEEVPLLGRIRIVKDEIAAHRAMRIEHVLQYASQAHLQSNAPYGWSWAATMFLDNHPRYRDRFRKLTSKISDPDFNKVLREAYAEDWDRLSEEWIVFITGIEHGYDFERNAIEYAAGQPLPAEGSQVTVAADRGWQSSGVMLEGGKQYHLRARGRYQIAEQPAGRIWSCEPGGVTIRYYQGRPLGMLLAAVRPDQQDPEFVTPLMEPAPVGLEAIISPDQPGTLYFRVNDSAAELADNAGELIVEVVAQ